jgi:hypothetical protein
MSSEQSPCLGDMTSDSPCGKVAKEEALRDDLIESCHRLARVWREREAIESDLWKEFETAIQRCKTLPEAYAIYRAFSSRRMGMVIEDVQRTFDEFRDISGTFG